VPPERLRGLIKAEMRAKIVFTIPTYPKGYDDWLQTLDETTEGIMDVLDKYDIKEREG
jgi:hypothetical protein